MLRIPIIFKRIQILLFSLMRILDPTFYSDADPDLDPSFDADPDPNPTAHFFPDLDPPMLQNDPLRLLSLLFDADPGSDPVPDHAFHFDADTDFGSVLHPGKSVHTECVGGRGGGR